MIVLSIRFWVPTAYLNLSNNISNSDPAKPTPIQHLPTLDDFYSTDLGKLVFLADFLKWESPHRRIKYENILFNW